MAVGRLSTADLVSSLRNALQKCKELHGSKCEVTLPKHIPNFWIIDTEENCLVPGDSVDKYVALSYVWRSPLDASSNQEPTQRLMLQWDKLDDFRKPGFLSSEPGVAEKLPEVIQDSMLFVQQSGVRYLWVDCLCIPQNDKTTGDNVLSMRDIYSGAYFTIIAAAGSPGLYGSGADIERVKNDKGVPDAGSLHGALLTTHWATRGWTFQEQMLSMRSFVFLDETAFWNCQDAVWWSESLITNQETGDSEQNTPKGDNRHSRFISQSKTDGIETRIYDENRQLSQNLTVLSTPDFRLYIELICRYNYRDLTYAQDALPAISGVLDALTRGFSGGFISGLPAIFLDSALLWQPLFKAKRRVCSDEKPESSPALPSWSWAGWQCLIDPASLESGLDYEVRDRASRGGWGNPMDSWRTRKLVDWIGSTTVDDEFKILEPGILEKYKGLQDNPSDENLPDGWSHRTEDTDSAKGAKPHTSANRPNDWYSYNPDAKSVFRYPLPMTHVPLTVGGQGYKRFLSCTTSTANFNVRRVLYPYQKEGRMRGRSGRIFTSVLDTELYKNKPDLEMCCSVITLEDKQGRWAGLLRVMDDNESIKTYKTVEVVAISRGSTSRMEAASAYEETVDRLACYKFRGNNYADYYFASIENSQQKILHCHRDSRSECYKSMEKEAGGRDQGPFFLSGMSCSGLFHRGLPEEWQHENYDFYNVLWVERRGDFMERKAVGRVPKAIWEQNQGGLQSIKLG